MDNRVSPKSDFEQIPLAALRNVGGGNKGAGNVIKMVGQWFARQFSKNVDETQLGPRNKDFLDNSIREPAGRTTPKPTGPQGANDNFPGAGGDLPPGFGGD